MNNRPTQRGPTIKLIANDSTGDGTVELRFSHGAYSPFGLDFVTENRARNFGIAMSRGNAKALALFILENL